MKQTIKLIAPIFGGLALGDGISNILLGAAAQRTDMITWGIVELILGVSILSYTLYLILKRD